MNPWRTSRNQLGRGKLIPIVVALVVAAALAAILLSSSPESLDERGDVRLIEGSVQGDRPLSGELAASIADLIFADVVAEETGTLVLTAQVAVPAPRTFKSSALEFRWELDGDDESVWTLAVSIHRGAQVALFSDGGYGSGTIDDTLPGQLTIEGDTVEVRLDVRQIDGFPSKFEWNLATTLRAFRGEPDSPRVEDRFPNQGTEAFEG